MTKLEELNDNEWKYILDYLNFQIKVNEDIFNDFRCCDFGKEELQFIKEEQELLKSCVRKLEKMKGKVLYTYD